MQCYPWNNLDKYLILSVNTQVISLTHPIPHQLWHLTFILIYKFFKAVNKQDSTRLPHPSLTIEYEVELVLLCFFIIALEKHVMNTNTEHKDWEELETVASILIVSSIIQFVPSFYTKKSICPDFHRNIKVGDILFTSIERFAI